MNKIILFISVFVICIHGMGLRPKPNFKPMYHRQTEINRWHRFHSVIDGMGPDAKPNPKKFPKKWGPTPESCNYDCPLAYQTSYNIPLMDGEDHCQPFIRTRLVHIDFYKASDWKHMCFSPVSLCNTLGQNPGNYPEIHILKIPIFKKFTFLQSLFSQNSRF